MIKKIKLFKIKLMIVCLFVGMAAQAQLKVGKNPTNLAPGVMLQVEGSSSSQFVVDTFGKVGVGTTTPTQRLHVKGQVQIDTLMGGSSSDSVVMVDASGVLKKRNLSSILSSTDISKLVVQSPAKDSIINVISSNGKTLSNGNGILINGSNSLAKSVLADASLRIDSTVIAKMAGQSPVKDSLISVVNNQINLGNIIGQNLTAGTLLQTTGTPTGASLKAAGYQIDTTALKTFMNGKVQITTGGAPLTGDGTTSNPLGITRATATSGVLTTVTNGINAAFTALKYDVDTIALKTFLNGKVQSTVSAPLTGNGTSGSPLGITQNTLSAGQLTTVTGGTNATFTAASVGIDTTALKTFMNGKVQIATGGAPLTGDGTTSNPLGITRATATSGVLTTVSNGTNAAFTALQYDVDTTGLKTFLNGKVQSTVSAPLTGNGTSGSPLGITQNTLSAGQLTTVSGGTNATFTAASVGIDTTALKTFMTGKVQITTGGAPLTGDGTTSNPLGITRATATSGVLTTVTNGTNAAFTALKYDVDTTALKTFLTSRGVGADNWGTQTAVTNTTLTGNGTSSAPLGIAQNSATSGQVMTWNGTAWVPQNAPSGADNWGTQTAVTTAPISGNGTSGSPITMTSAALATALKTSPAMDTVAAIARANGDGDAWGVTGENISGTIGRTGSVGIGTGVPSAQFHVASPNGSTSGIARFTNSDYTDGTIGSGLFIMTGADTGNTYSAIMARSSGNLASNNLVMNQYGGNVGIGNASPSAKLEVTGNIKVTNKPTALVSDSVVMRYTDGELRQMSIARLLGQFDTDGDGIPDATDPDIDGDGVLNASDTCAKSPGCLPTGCPKSCPVLDTDGDGIPDYSDPDIDGDGIANASDTCKMQYGCTPSGCPRSCSSTSTATVTMDCTNSSFSCSPIYIGSTGSTVTFKVINNSFSTVGPIDFSTAVTLSGAGAAGLSVSSGQNSNITIVSGATATLTYNLSGAPTTAGALSATFLRLGLSCTVNTTVYSSSGGNGLNGSSSANANFSCNAIKQAFPSSADGVYWVDPDGDCTVYSPMQAQCDMTTDGGGWTLILNYVHQAFSNSSSVVRTTFPLIGSSTLGTNEGGNTTYWGHLSNSFLNSFNFSTIRFQGNSSASGGPVINFKTTTGVSYIKTGSGNFSGLATNYTALAGNTYNASTLSYFQSNLGDNALTLIPFGIIANNYWQIAQTGMCNPNIATGGCTSRWDVGTESCGCQLNTIHRVWVR